VINLHKGLTALVVAGQCFPCEFHLDLVVAWSATGSRDQLRDIPNELRGFGRLAGGADGSS
jgi:hypothetical protein